MTKVLLNTKGKDKSAYTWYSASLWSTTSEALEYGAFSRDLACTVAHPHVHPQLEWAIPAFAFPAIADTHLPTPEGMNAELAWVAGYVVRPFTRSKPVAHSIANQLWPL